MTTHTAERVDDPARVAVKPVSFVRVLRSEWSKLWGLPLDVLDDPGHPGCDGAHRRPARCGLDDRAGSRGARGQMTIGMGYTFAQVVVAALGVLTMTGEYSPGMIRSALGAVPARRPALGAKVVLVAGVGFVLGVVGVALSSLAGYPLLSAEGAADLADPQVQRTFWGSGVYLAGDALFGQAVGALLRQAAGAITLVLGLLLLLSTFWQLLMMTSEWFTRIYPYLPSTAGERIAAPEVTSTVADAPQALGP